MFEIAGEDIIPLGEVILIINKKRSLLRLRVDMISEVSFDQVNGRVVELGLRQGSQGAEQVDDKLLDGLRGYESQQDGLYYSYYSRHGSEIIMDGVIYTKKEGLGSPL